jgi:Pyruvate/2-oxoacid:ferredoxin oxidoreductase delta subunit
MTKIFKRYHIETKDAISKINFPSKYIIKRYNNCLNVQECAQTCIFDVHQADKNGKIMDPFNNYCRGCHLCTLACPKGAISLSLNPEFEKLGDSYFNADRMKTIYFEAETGRVPVSGTGYKGQFAGKGFDGMWFDFSEIVRPTRDGIHGREYISTSVDLGRKLSFLKFDNNRNLVSTIPMTIEIPIPMILDAPLSFKTGKNLLMALAKAALKLNTFAIIKAEDYSNNLIKYRSNLIPRITYNKIEEFGYLIKQSRIVEIEYEDFDIKYLLDRIKKYNPSILISIHIQYDKKTCEKVDNLTKSGIDIIHIYSNEEVCIRNPDFITDSIFKIHSHLVNKNIRDKITLITSGGIAEASHVPKSIILGADAVGIGLAYQIALGCKVCYKNKHRTDCFINVEEEDIDLASQRIINLIGSWRDQLLEILGGMGLREVRRQRGEIGRAMFYKNLEEKIFGDNT